MTRDIVYVRRCPDEVKGQSTVQGIRSSVLVYFNRLGREKRLLTHERRDNDPLAP